MSVTWLICLQPKHYSTWNSICPSVCPLSIVSPIHPPSAKFIVKIPMCIAVQNFLTVQFMGKLLSIHTSSDSSVNPLGSLSVTLSPSAENLSKFPSNNGEKNAENYLHEIPVKVPTVCTSSVMSVVAPISASSVPSIHPYDECQEILDEFTCTKYCEKFPSEIIGKVPDDVTITLHQEKFPEKTPGNSYGVNYSVQFLPG